jgi:hypothetical protein
MRNETKASLVELLDKRESGGTRGSWPFIVLGLILLALAALMFIVVALYRPAQAAPVEGQLEDVQPTPQSTQEPPQPPSHASRSVTTAAQTRGRVTLAPPPTRRTPVPLPPAQRSESKTVVESQQQQQPTMGRINVSTNPGGYRILIDGVEQGTTSPTVQQIDQTPGRHTVEILFPNNTRLVREFNIIAGRTNSIALNYHTRTIEIRHDAQTSGKVETVDPGEVTSMSGNVPPRLTLNADAQVVTVCPDAKSKANPSVHLKAKAFSPEGHALRYSWRTNGGRIEGDGANVLWDLSGVQPGSYQATVTVESGFCISFTSMVVVVRQCPQPPTKPDGEAGISASPVTFSRLQNGETVEVGEVSGTYCDSGELAHSSTEDLPIIIGDPETPVGSSHHSHARHHTVSPTPQPTPKVPDVAFIKVPVVIARSSPKSTRKKTTPPESATGATSQTTQPSPVSTPDVTATPPAPQVKQKDKIAVSYPERFLKDKDSTLRVELSRVAEVITGTTTADGKVEVVAKPGEIAGATNSGAPMSEAFGSEYKAFATVTLISTDLVTREAPPQAEQSLDPDAVVWEWHVRPDQNFKEVAQFAFQIDVVWRGAGLPDIHRRAVWRKDFPLVPVGPPTGIKILSYGSPITGGGGGGIMVAGAIKKTRKRKKKGEADDDEDAPVSVAQSGVAAHGAAATGGAQVIADEVECTVFGPKSAHPGDTFILPVFAHLAEQEGELEELAAVYEAAKLSESKSLDQKIERDSKLYFSLQLPGLSIDEQDMSLIWKGKVNSVEFGVTVPKEFEPKNVIGTVIVCITAAEVARVPIGHIKFMLKVTAPEATQAATVASAQLPAQTPPAQPAASAQTMAAPLEQNYVSHKKAFISYSSKNRLEVDKRVQGLLAAGIECFMDKMTLKPGMNWESSLYQFIDQSDIFYLFWSRDAAASIPINDEIDYALKRKGDNWMSPPEIIPIPLEPTTVVKPPERLKQLHFDDLMLTVIKAAEAEQQQQQPPPAQG